LRDLTRYRTRLVEERAREVNRLQKTLEDTNLKRGDVVSDIMGKAARAMLQAIVAGETDPGRLADLARGRVHTPGEELERAVTGKVTAHHRCLLGEHLRQIASLESAIRRVSDEIARRFSLPDPPEERRHEPPHSSNEAALLTSTDEAARPLTWEEAVELIDPITGISTLAAEAHPHRTRRRHGPLCQCQACSLLGGCVPGQPRKRRQTPEWQDLASVIPG
jgi:transposase